MELLRINDRKLKVMLSKEDLSALSLTAETIDYDNTETRRAFWSILDEAKHKTGFDAAKDKIYVQVYPSHSGGCEMYVTRLSAPGDGSPIAFSKEPLFAEKMLFRFDSLDNMLSACAVLAERGFASPSSAYAETNCYYLAVGEDSRFALPAGSRTLSCADLVLEFGVKIDKAAEGWLCEHGECICPEHAVERYASLAG